jgi:hypothetical protein
MAVLAMRRLLRAFPRAPPRRGRSFTCRDVFAAWASGNAAAAGHAVRWAVGGTMCLVAGFWIAAAVSRGVWEGWVLGAVGVGAAQSLGVACDVAWDVMAPPERPGP